MCTINSKIQKKKKSSTKWLCSQSKIKIPVYGVYNGSTSKNTGTLIVYSDREVDGHKNSILSDTTPLAAGTTVFDTQEHWRISCHTYMQGATEYPTETKALLYILNTATWRF